MMAAMRAGVAVAVAGLALAACGKKGVVDAGVAARPIDAGARPIPACEKYAAALADSDDLVAQPELHDLLRDEAALVRAANRAPTDADRAELTLRCAAGLVDLGKISTDGFDGDAGAPLAVADAALAAAGTGPDCTQMVQLFDRIEGCGDIPDQERVRFRDRRSHLTRTWPYTTDPSSFDEIERLCRIAISGLQHELTQYSCP
jgi:hypothetical protein